MTGGLSPAGDGPPAGTGPELRASHQDRDRAVEILLLVTRPGIEVSADDVALRGSSVKVRPDTSSEWPVILRIEVSGEAEGGSIEARPPRRTLWRWLRKPRSPYGQ